MQRRLKQMQMKTKFLLLTALAVIAGLPGYSQEKSSKERKEEKKLAVQQQVDSLMNAREYVFTGENAYPTGYRTVTLTGRQNQVKFHPEMIESDMPYFGKANSNVAYASSSGGGLKFSGKPEEYTFEKKKKNYQVGMVVREPGDSYRISLVVQFSGDASLTIISNNRSPISYNGYISGPEAK
jgi:hypothetical protein